VLHRKHHDDKIQLSGFKERGAKNWKKGRKNKKKKRKKKKKKNNAQLNANDGRQPILERGKGKELEASGKLTQNAQFNKRLVNNLKNALNDVWTTPRSRPPSERLRGVREKMPQS